MVHDESAVNGAFDHPSFSWGENPNLFLGIVIFLFVFFGK